MAWPTLCRGAAASVRPCSLAVLVLIAVLPPSDRFVSELLATLFCGWLRCGSAARLRARANRATAAPTSASDLHHYRFALYREAPRSTALLSADRAAGLPGRKARRHHRRSRPTTAKHARQSPRDKPLAGHSDSGSAASGRAPNPRRLMSRCRSRAATFTVIYDAEDRPETESASPRLARFRAGGNDLACVQARLCIDNTADSWLAGFSPPNMPASSTCSCRGSRPCACRCRSAARPIISAPRRCARSAAWDAYNVTEDADLGMRLARFGYRCGRNRFHDLRRSAGQFGALAAPAHALVQRLDADLAGAYA